MENAVNRSFVKSLGSKAAAMAHPLGAAMKLADFLRIGDRRHKHSATRFLMGTQVSIVALHDSKDAAQHAAELAFLEIERLSAIFDRHQSGSPVSLLNETGKLSDVAPELFEVMGKAQVYYHRSNGTFDLTVLPVLEILQENRDSKGSLLGQSDLDDALGLVGSNFVNICKNGISFSKNSMAVTLDGIGRGYIVDRASDILAANGVENHLIIAGGDVRACGERSPGQPWIVAIEDPSGKGGYPAVIRLKDAAVSTSGGCELYFDAEHSHCHVANLKAAVSSSCQRGSLSVVAPSVLEADALSTSAFVMNPEDAVCFINAQKQSECLISGLSGVKMHSRNWEAQVGI